LNRILIARWLTLVGYFGLLILLTLWTVWLAPPRESSISLVLIILITPLLFPLRGLLHARPYTHAWTSFLALFYFILGVVVAYANEDERLLGILEIVFSIMLYTGAILFARFKSKELMNH